jgi:hypothetical protein
VKTDYQLQAKDPQCVSTANTAPTTGEFDESIGEDKDDEGDTAT